MTSKRGKPDLKLSDRARKLARQYSKALESNDRGVIRRVLTLADHDQDAAKAVEVVHGYRGGGPWEGDETCVPGSTEDGGCEA